ncbi:hypothetical protein E5D57_005229 [Metarhizium anisopliae]|nr:hypothetical protein E5D57_005229 [Metarhizium anisopliae]
MSMYWIVATGEAAVAAVATPVIPSAEVVGRLDNPTETDSPQHNAKANIGWYFVGIMFRAN